MCRRRRSGACRRRGAARRPPRRLRAAVAPELRPPGASASGGRGGRRRAAPGAGAGPGAAPRRSTGAGWSVIDSAWSCGSLVCATGALVSLDLPGRLEAPARVVRFGAGSVPWTQNVTQREQDDLLCVPAASRDSHRDSHQPNDRVPEVGGLGRASGQCASLCLVVNPSASSGGRAVTQTRRPRSAG